MKKILTIVAMVVLASSLVGCASSNSNDNVNTGSSITVDTEMDSSGSVDSEMDITELKQGDEVSIVGQVASSGLVNGDTLWVQVKQSDGSFVLYHCHLKDEFLERAASLKTLSIAKVNGFFLSLMDLEMENTMPLATLYDCELVE